MERSKASEISPALITGLHCHVFDLQWSPEMGTADKLKNMDLPKKLRHAFGKIPHFNYR